MGLKRLNYIPGIYGLVFDIFSAVSPGIGFTMRNSFPAVTTYVDDISDHLSQRPLATSYWRVRLVCNTAI